MISVNNLVSQAVIGVADIVFVSKLILRWECLRHRSSRELRYGHLEYTKLPD